MKRGQSLPPLPGKPQSANRRETSEEAKTWFANLPPAPQQNTLEDVSVNRGRNRVRVDPSTHYLSHQQRSERSYSPLRQIRKAGKLFIDDEPYKEFSQPHIDIYNKLKRGLFNASNFQKQLLDANTNNLQDKMSEFNIYSNHPEKAAAWYDKKDYTLNLNLDKILRYPEFCLLYTSDAADE